MKVSTFTAGHLLEASEVLLKPTQLEVLLTGDKGLGDGLSSSAFPGGSE